jgi:hypothetical protein
VALCQSQLNTEEHRESTSHRRHRRQLGVRFVALAVRAFLAGTPIGEAAAAAYDRDIGELDPTGVARAIVAIAKSEEHRDATLLAVTGTGVEAI